MTLLLMAAGSGSRYGGLKQFDTLGPKEEFLMEFSIFDAIKNGFDHIVVITKAENQTYLQEYLGSKLPANIKLDVLVQDINDIPEEIKIEGERLKPWGTAHAVWTAREIVNNNFVIINADDYYGKEAFEFAGNFIRSNSSSTTYALVGYSLKDTLSPHGSVSRGVCEVDNKELTSIVERTKIIRKSDGIIDEESGIILDEDTVVSMNFWICNPSIFNYTESYFEKFLKNTENHAKNEIYLPFVAQQMMSEGLISIHVLDAKSKWFGVTYADDRQQAVDTLSEITEQGGYPSPVW